MNLIWKNSGRYGKDGYAALLGVLVVGAVSVSVVLSMLLLGMQSSRTSFTSQQSAQAKGLADACMEEALREIRDTASYSGSDSLSFDVGDCEYTVSSSGGQNRTITSEGSVDTVVRKVEVEIDQINPEINVVSWQEVADF